MNQDKPKTGGGGKRRMIEQAERKKRHPIFRLFWTLFWLGFPKHKVFGLSTVPKDRPAVFVANHAGAYGPVAMITSFHRRFRPWVISNMCSLRTAPAHLAKDLFPAKTRVGKAFSFLISAIVAPLAVLVMYAVEAIPVYKDARVITTFNKSLRTLLGGTNVLIFPENDEPFSEYTNNFSGGFLYIARRYYEETGRRLEYYPVFASSKYHAIKVGTPLTYDPSDDFAQQKVRAANYLRDSVTCMARELEIEKTAKTKKSGA
ncbi:MAG: hypothetical protein Q8O09_01005 [Bacillota bacterium]|nr:hypothetical protein [Bacillota bacterium]